MPIKILITKDYETLSEHAAKIIAERISDDPETVLGLATGRTPLGCYRKLIEWNLDFSRVTIFALDEFLGLPSTHPSSCGYYLRHRLLNYLNVSDKNIHLLNGMCEKPELECEEYERKISGAGGIDLQILGIGINGHIGLNEPGSPLNSRTRVVQLSRETVERCRSFFGPEVPERALTMGVGTIMESKEILLLASGREKAEIIKKTVEGPVDENVPSSVLQTHTRCTFLLDEEAASGLNL